MLAWIFLLIFIVAAPVAVVAGWTRTTLRDQTAYVQAARRVAAAPEVQQALSSRVNGEIKKAVIGENPTAGEAILYRQVEGQIATAVDGVLASGEFADIWAKANGEAYAFLAGGLAAGAGQPVVIDLGPLQEAIETEVDRRGIALPAGWERDEEDLRIQILDAATADRVRAAMRNLDLVSGVAVAATLLSLLLSVGLAPDRLAAIARVGFALTLGMIVLIAAIVVGEGWLASAAGSDGPVIAAMLDGVSQVLRLAVIVLAMAGLILAAVFGGLAALRRSIARRRAIAG